jgi:hypothetical protein
MCDQLTAVSTNPVVNLLLCLPPASILLSDIPAGDGKFANLFYSAETGGGGGGASGTVSA